MNSENQCNSHMLCEERFKNILDKLQDTNGRIELYDGTKEVLVELKMLTAQLVKANDQKDGILHEHTVVLNQTMQSLRDVIEIQKSQGEKIQEIDDKVNSVNDKSKVDFADITRNFLFAALGAMAVVAVEIMMK